MQQTQYRNYAHPPQRSPHTAAGRRGPGPMVPNPHVSQAPTPQQIQAQQAAEAQRREMARRQSRKPTDRNLPDGIEEIAIADGPAQYKALRDVERRLDAVIMRKRLDVQNSITKSSKRHRTMRVWISNTVENQPWQQTALEADAFDFNFDTQATYRVKIEGVLQPDEDGSDEGATDAEKETEGQNGDAMDTEGDAGTSAKKPAKAVDSNLGQRTKLSHFFKSITVDFERSRSLQPDGFTQVEWKKPESRPTGPNMAAGAPSAAPEANFDCLEFERKGDENMNVTINLVPDESPESFKLSEPLANLLDTEVDDRAGVVMGIWNYIKACGLQEDEDTRKIHCDARMKAVFGADTIFFPHIPEMVVQHLTPLPPIQLPYTIRVDRGFHTASDENPDPPQPTIYDIQVCLEDPLRATLFAITHSPNYGPTLQKIAGLDEAIAHTVQAIVDSKAKHAFFSSMARDPARFLLRWISSQRRDLEVILGEREEGLRAGEEFRLSGDTGVWEGDLARESVGLWLARQPRPM